MTWNNIRNKNFILYETFISRSLFINCAMRRFMITDKIMLEQIFEQIIRTTLIPIQPEDTQSSYAKMAVHTVITYWRHNMRLCSAFSSHFPRDFMNGNYVSISNLPQACYLPHSSLLLRNILLGTCSHTSPALSPWLCSYRSLLFPHTIQETGRPFKQQTYSGATNISN